MGKFEEIKPARRLAHLKIPDFSGETFLETCEIEKQRW